MYNIVYVGETIEKRIKTIKTINSVKLYVYNDSKLIKNIPIDLIIVNDVCVCKTIKTSQMYENTPVIRIYDDINTHDSNCKCDLIISSNTTDLEFKKNILCLLKMKSILDEKSKIQIINKIEIKDKTDRFNKIINTIDDGVIITNSDGYITDINKTAKFMCAYDKFNKLQHIDNILNVYYNDSKIDIYDSTINTKEKLELSNNTKIYLKNNDYYHIHITSSKIKNNDKLNGILIIIKNITREVTILTELKNSEEKYKKIYNNAPDVIYTHDINGKFTSINKTEDFGYKPYEVIGHNISEYMDKNNLELAKKQILHKINNPQDVTEYEIEISHKDGHLVPLAIKSILSTNKDGVYEIFSIGRNITDKIKSRKIIKAEQERYKQMFFNTKSNVIIFKFIDNEFHIIDYNKKGDLLSTLNDDEIKNVNIKTLSNIFIEINEFLRTVYNQNRYFRLDDFMMYINNHINYLSIFIYKLNHVNELVMIYENVSDIRLLMTSLEDAKYKAEESDNLKTQFISNISHEIRTPMNAIKGYSSLLRDHMHDNDKLSIYINNIEKSSDDLLAIINDIMEIAIIENGSIKIYNDYFNLIGFLEDIKKEIFAILKEKNKSYILINFIIPTIDEIICTDKRRLSQILFNIIDNSIKFTEKGYIQISCNIENSDIVFNVKDTGIGIGNDDILKIFDRFYKVKNTKKFSSGTGLGLSISKQLSIKMGGDVWVESVLGGGSTFYVKIPKHTEKIEIVVNKPVVIDWSNKKIIIVEDIAVNFRLLQLYLESTKINIIWAKDGQEFYSKISKDIDLILLDIQLPDTDGLSILKWIRNNKMNVPVIIQTAFASAEDKSRAMKMGATEYLSKPITKKILYDSISKILN